MNSNERIVKMESEILMLKQDIDKLEEEISSIKKDFKQYETKVSDVLNKLLIEVHSLKSEMKLYSKIPAGILLFLSIINVIIAILINLKGFGQ